MTERGFKPDEVRLFPTPNPRPTSLVWLCVIGLFVAAGVTFCAVKTAWIIYGSIQYAASDLYTSGEP